MKICQKMSILPQIIKSMEAGAIFAWLTIIPQCFHGAYHIPGSQYLLELKWITVAWIEFYVKHWTSILGRFSGWTQDQVMKYEEQLRWSLDPAHCLQLILHSIPWSMPPLQFLLLPSPSWQIRHFENTHIHSCTQTCMGLHFCWV